MLEEIYTVMVTFSLYNNIELIGAENERVYASPCHYKVPRIELYSVWVFSIL